jgi:hypothetical protein
MPPALARLLALFSLLACLAFPLLYFWGQITLPAYKNLLAAATLAWFVFATIAVARRTPER